MEVLLGLTKGIHPLSDKLELNSKQLVACESTAEKVSFEWSAHLSLRFLPSEFSVYFNFEKSENRNTWLSVDNWL